MPIRTKLELAGGVLFALLLGVLMWAWHGAHDDALKLEATIAAQKEVISQADKRQADRDAALKVTLDGLEDLKKRAQSPQEVVTALPAVVPLPKPIYLAARPNAPQGQGNKAGPEPPPDAILPAEDVKPLLDFGIECQECKAKLAAAQANRQDDQIKIKALTKERDDAVTAVKGGTRWQRIKRAGKWLAIGAITGYVAAKAH